jgi:hypothetical protein
MIMVRISEGDEPAKVPLVYYDENGERHVIGNAAVQIQNGEVIALGQITEHMQGEWFTDGMNIEGFSIGPFTTSPAEEASRRLGPLSLGSRQHVTETNPDGKVEPCPRLDLHGPHEWPADPEAYFNVYCPGRSLT